MPASQKPGGKSQKGKEQPPKRELSPQCPTGSVVGVRTVHIGVPLDSHWVLFVQEALVVVAQLSQTRVVADQIPRVFDTEAVFFHGTARSHV